VILEELLKILEAKYECAVQRIEELEKENAELRARLNKNSNNSSKPPSSDGYRKQAKITAPKNGIKGGQKDHRGNTLHQVDNPDKIELCTPDTCECGHHFTSTDMYSPEKRQLFDLPQPKLFVTEYQIFKAKCPECGKVQAGATPLKAPVQYGNGVKTLITMLNTQYTIPLNKIRQLVSDLFGFSINEATIQASNKSLHEQLLETEAIIKETVKSSEVVNVDETGIRIDKKLHWIHTNSTPLHTCLFAHRNRGKEAINSEKGIVPELKQWLVHDCWSSYFPFDNAKHALCGAHLIRELQGIIDSGDSPGASKMQHFLLELYKTDFEERLVNKENIIADYEKACAEWAMEEPLPEKIEGKRGKTKKTKSRNLLERMQGLKEMVLAFAFNDGVPFTNNLAERDLRPVKLKQKVSNCFRSFESAEIYARIESFISTCRKNNRNIFNEILNSFNGHNFLTLDSS